MKEQNHLRETENKMFIDLHLHESAYSPDSQMPLDELVQAAREKGLGAVCITDHDSMGLTEYAKEYSREHQYPVLVGAEFFSLWEISRRLVLTRSRTTGSAPRSLLITSMKETDFAFPVIRSATITVVLRST